jgi:thiol-disulfide isomerase/thioredoxin
MKRIALLAVALFIFCFGIVVPGCTQGKTGAAPEVNAGKWLNTESFKLADHKDKIVVVEFWATWCPPCRASIPHLKKLHETYKDKGLVLVSLSNEPVDTVTEFGKKADMTWIVGAESNSGSDYGVSGIPSAFIVVNGEIVWNGHPMGGLDAEIEKLVAARQTTTTAEPAPTTTEPAATTDTAAPTDAAPAQEAPVQNDAAATPETGAAAPAGGM